MDKEIVLEDYQVSATHGFLPSEPPLQRLPPCYDAWESTSSDLHKLQVSGALTANVAQLPLLSTANLVDEPQWRRAYVLLGYIAHAYIWGAEEPLEVSLDQRLSTGLTTNRHCQPRLLCHYSLQPNI